MIAPDVSIVHPSVLGLPLTVHLLVSLEREGLAELDAFTRKLRARPETFADHYSQARQFYISQTAIEQKHIPSTNETIGKYFVEHLSAKADAPKRAITIEDLLMMQSGLESTSGRNYGAWVTSRNWVRFALSRPLETEPGEEMEYSTGNTHLLSAILTKATRKSTWQYAQEVLGWAPQVKLREGLERTIEQSGHAQLVGHAR